MRSPRSLARLAILCAPAFLAATAAAELPTQDWTRTETRADCASYNPLRSPFFGETHIHTSFSGDAAFVRVRTTPRDAYRFALGEQIGLPPYDAMDLPTRFAQLHRPLDFTAVTDHSEFLGEIRTCLTPGLPGYDDQICQDTRTEIASPPAGINAPLPLVVIAFQLTIQDANPMRLGLCGPGGVNCTNQAALVWQDELDAAEEFYDRTDACGFTTFPGVRVDEQPERLQPAPQRHLPERRGPGAADELLRAAAGRRALRHARERLPRPARQLRLPLDPAQLERERRPDVPGRQRQRHAAHQGRRRAPRRARAAWSRSSSTRAARNAARELAERRALRLRAAATPPALPERQPEPRATAPELRAHTPSRKASARTTCSAPTPSSSASSAAPTATAASPGGVVEEDFGTTGHLGVRDGSAENILSKIAPGGVVTNGGGLAVLWAEENSRDALFAAMRRREAYATSGTRPIVRFFGGRPPKDACDDPGVRRGGLHARRPDGRRDRTRARAPEPALRRHGDAGSGRRRRAEHAAPAHPDRERLGRRRPQDPRARLRRRGRRRQRRRRRRHHLRADGHGRGVALHGLAGSVVPPRGARLLLRPCPRKPGLSLEHAALQLARRRLQQPRLGADDLSRVLLRHRRQDHPGARLDVADLLPTRGSRHEGPDRVRPRGDDRQAPPPAHDRPGADRPRRRRPTASA